MKEERVPHSEKPLHQRGAQSKTERELQGLRGEPSHQPGADRAESPARTVQPPGWEDRAERPAQMVQPSGWEDRAERPAQMVQPPGWEDRAERPAWTVQPPGWEDRAERPARTVQPPACARDTRPLMSAVGLGAETQASEDSPRGRTVVGCMQTA